MLKIALLRKYRPNGARSQASRRFDQRQCVGISDALGSRISPLVFTAENNIHSSGKTTKSTEIVTSR